MLLFSKVVKNLRFSSGRPNPTPGLRNKDPGIPPEWSKSEDPKDSRIPPRVI